jgi:DNA polymerase
MTKPETCLGCPYYSRTLVEGDGYVGAELIIVGQSPGEQEAREGKPFVGASGQILNRALRSADISRNQNYVTNVVKCFVPAGEKVEAEAVRKCKPLLDAELHTLTKARTILAVGTEAFNAISGKELKLVHNRKSAESNPRAWLRGTPLRVGNHTIIGTLHPSFVMRSGFLNAPTFEHDVRRAGEFASGARRIPDDHQITSPSDREVEEYTQLIMARGEGSLDIETPEVTADEDESDAIVETPISLIGLSANIGESISVNPGQFPLLDPLLGDNTPRERTRLWVYNGGFDFLHLGRRWPMLFVEPADAMIAFFLLWSDVMSFDFATAASYYANFGYYKNWRKLDPYRYETIGNCRDTYGAMQIGQECLKEMRKKPVSMEPLFWSLMPVIKAVEPWRTLGCNYDTAGSMRTYLQLMKMLEGYETWWSQNIPRWDWSSPKQLVEMFTALGVKVPLKKRPNGKFSPTVDDDALETMEKKSGSSVIPLIREMRTLRKASDFVNLADRDGRVRTRAKLHGQAGGRIQLVDKSLQTIPETLAGTYPRSLIIPDHPDDLILISDFSQAEFFIYAWYTQDPALLEIHASGDYCYGFFHEEIWKEPFFEAGKPRQKKFMRKDLEPWKLLVTKSYPLGITYGRTAIDSQYKWLLDWYHKKFTRVNPFHSSLIYQATNAGFLQTCFARMRRFPNAKGQRNQILAFPGQTTLPDILIRNAILPLGRSLPANFGERSRVLFTVHDSVICNIHGAARSYKVAANAIDHVTETLQQPILEMNGFNLYAETKIGPNWSENYGQHKLEGWWNSRGPQIPI